MRTRRILLLAATQLLLSLVINQLVSLPDHSLGDSGGWTATKATLARGVMGAQHFLTDNKAIGQNHLNLSAWNGFQEVILDRETRARAVEFDFHLKRGAYVVFIFNKSAGGFSGIRLSAARRFESIFFTADSRGGFLDKRPIGHRRVAPDEWHHTRVSFGADSVSLRVDEEPGWEFSTDLLGTQRIGFRGGLKEALVDSVIVSGDQLFEEDFQQAFRGSVYLAAIAGVAGVELVLLLGLAVTRRHPEKWLAAEPVFALTTLNLVLVVVGAAACAYFFFFAQTRYPLAVAQQENEERWQLVEAQTVRQVIREAHPVGKEAGAYRILVIGSSQTWGAGAVEEADVFTERLGALLNEDDDLEMRFECINAGISALKSEVLIGDFYLNEWIHLDPDLVIVNLGTNDAHRDRRSLEAVGRGGLLERNLQTLAVINADRQIDTLLIGEANASEVEFSGRTWYLKGKLEIIRRVAEQNDLPYFDMHQYLLEHYDDGFLWWDFVHLTSFGHELVAHKLHQVIKEQVWAHGE